MNDLSDERPDYDEPGPERRTGSGTDRRLHPSIATMELVQAAARTAAGTVIEQRQRKTVVYSVLAALVVALAVALPLTLYVSSQNREAATSNARFNCVQWNKGADTLADYIKSTAKLQRDQAGLVAKRQDVLQKISTIFGAGAYQDLQRKSAVLNIRAFTYWTGTLIPRLKRIAEVNCDATITASGVSTTANSGKKKTRPHATAKG